MVTFMEESHRRKSDGTFVDKKAEAIAQRCRAAHEEKLTQLSQLSDTPPDYQLSVAEKDEIFRSQVEIKKGRRFGVGSIPFDDVGAGSSSASHASQAEMTAANEQIAALKSEMKQMHFWCELMVRQYPNAVPLPGPSSQNPTGQSESDNFDFDFGRS
ncbi:uncharacterized protein LOC111830507 [Capsella rubella]|uniref:uncharacterized protein LOC111830507 n=1 Tax=Capsella rubella TaxID=81985 RepID=UPI000CD5A3A6|nr:uncharacterized protein LOC111830507 [Capsella rubella]